MKTLEDRKAITFFVLPATLIYTFLVFVPIAFSLGLSLFNWNGIGNARFTGILNYVLLTNDAVFLQSLLNNIYYVLLIVFVQMSFGLAVAILLTYLKFGRGFVQTVYFIPSVITVIAIAQLFRSFYSYTPVGLINGILTSLGLQPHDFLGEFSTVLPAVSVVEGWQYIGIYMIIFYSGLVSVPAEIENAARIDGASELQMMWRIKVPYIKNIIGLSLILSLVGALKGFAVPYNLTNGGPSHHSELLSTYLYKVAFSNQQYGSGSAIAVVIMVISLIGVLLINRNFYESE
jgi:raffinose/stachyose/melibiose transport system permease protein